MELMSEVGFRNAGGAWAAMMLAGLLVLIAATMSACGSGAKQEPEPGLEPTGGDATATPGDRKSWAGTEPSPEFPGGLTWFNVQTPPTVAFVPAVPEPSGCDPNYTGCVPIDSDVDCAGGSGNGPSYAQGPVQVIGADIYGLDRDGDGIGCE